MKEDKKIIKKYIEVANNFKKLRIAVIGDFILDKYVWGVCSRISPEAPVPIVKVQSYEYRLGGAGNVSANLSSLGCMVDAYGLIGNDSAGESVSELLKQESINSYLKESNNGKQTSLKTRIIADQQQVVRTDDENTKDITAKDADWLFNKMANNVKKYDAMIVSDYAKGVLIPKLTRKVIPLFRNKNKIVIIDPKGTNFKKYCGASAITPNFKEFKDLINKPELKVNAIEIEKYADKLKKELDIKGLLVTLGRQGVFIINQKGEYRVIPTRAKEVFDVSGAGDTFIALFTASLAVEGNWFTAGEIANHGAGIVIGKVGTSHIKKEELIKSWGEYL